MRSSQMMNYSIPLVILSASTRTAASSLWKRNSTQQWTFDEIPSSANLVWYPCLSTYFCAMLDVPLEYSKPNGTHASVPLIKIPAQTNSTNGSYQGMLLTNPGGPGDPGVDFLLENGFSTLVPVVGTNFDIVSFDPRGMGRSIPLADCSSNTNTKLRRRAFGLTALGQECNATIGGPDEVGPHMSTAVVARDMLSVVDAFAATESGKSVETSSLLNYWGFSYGTFIGETFASMYPDRVGRMAIDGVVDPDDYVTGQDLNDIDFEDAVISTFFTYCHVAGPSLCDFYTGTSARDIQSRFENIFNQLNAPYAASRNWSNATLLMESLALIKSTVRLTAYTPITSFPILATQLVAYESALHNLTLESIQAASSLGDTTPNVTGTLPELTEWLPAVACSDAPSIYNETYEDLRTFIAGLEQESFVGGEVWASIKVYCTGWPILATWRYAGPFGGCPKNPLLFVSNTLDPATPITNSQKWAPQFEGSQLLTVEAIGHTSMAAQNNCANQKIARFFQTGELPGKDSLCAAEAGPFGVTLRGLDSLAATRGEIATRILSTARELGIETFTLYTKNDTSHTLHSTHALELRSPASYLNISELLALVKKYEVDTIHPGYGFLSESPEFAQRMWEEADCHVIGPGPSILSQTGDKLQARNLAVSCSVPVLPALQTPTSSVPSLSSFAKEVGYPIIIKAVDGGGGRGIRIVRKEEELGDSLERALKESPSQQVFAEKAVIEGWRHIEVQIVGDGKGNVRHLWERECSVQRRFQKVVEWAPSSVQDRGLIERVVKAAVRMGEEVNYNSVGTFEFLLHPSSSQFYFLEINPRLQVEHTITESLALNLDLIKIQFLLAQGAPLSSLLPSLSPSPLTPPPLYSLQLRLTAEDPSFSFSLSVGKISSFSFPTGNGIRIDTHLHPLQPTVIGTDFDSLIAKIIITAPSWLDVVRKARRALQDTVINGVKTNLDILRGIVSSPAFERRDCDTQWLETHLPELLDSGRSITSLISKHQGVKTRNEMTNTISSSASNIMFRKGDAWEITLTPESEDSNPKIKESTPAPNHLQILRINRNEFPSSLSASILYTHSSSSSPSAPQPQPQPYTLSLSSTTSSAAFLSSLSTHRRGDPNNGTHVILPFSGKLMEILVEEGDLVKEGNAVAVVRQMKMELEVRAPRGGKVAWVYEGIEGDEVGEGVLVAIVVETEGEGRAKL